jgi:hypothetical protein
MAATDSKRGPEPAGKPVGLASDGARGSCRTDRSVRERHAHDSETPPTHTWRGLLIVAPPARRSGNRHTCGPRTVAWPAGSPTCRALPCHGAASARIPRACAAQRPGDRSTGPYQPSPHLEDERDCHRVDHSSRRRESNPQSTAYKAVALPLSHSGVLRKDRGCDRREQTSALRVIPPGRPGAGVVIERPVAQARAQWRLRYLCSAATVAAFRRREPSRRALILI